MGPILSCLQRICHNLPCSRHSKTTQSSETSTRPNSSQQRRLHSTKVSAAPLPTVPTTSEIITLTPRRVEPSFTMGSTTLSLETSPKLVSTGSVRISTLTIRPSIPDMITTLQQLIDRLDPPHKDEGLINLPAEFSTPIIRCIQELFYSRDSLKDLPTAKLFELLTLIPASPLTAYNPDTQDWSAHPFQQLYNWIITHFITDRMDQLTRSNILACMRQDLDSDTKFTLTTLYATELNLTFVPNSDRRFPSILMSPMDLLTLIVPEDEKANISLIVRTISNKSKDHQHITMDEETPCFFPLSQSAVFRNPSQIFIKHTVVECTPDLLPTAADTPPCLFVSGSDPQMHYFIYTDFNLKRSRFGPDGVAKTKGTHRLKNPFGLEIPAYGNTAADDSELARAITYPNLNGYNKKTPHLLELLLRGTLPPSILTPKPFKIKEASARSVLTTVTSDFALPGTPYSPD